MRTDHLLFGAAYYLEYLPYDRLETDMEMMERAGMNTIRIAESTWSTLEPSDGVFDFTCIDRMVQAAAKHQELRNGRSAGSADVRRFPEEKIPGHFGFQP